MKTPGQVKFINALVQFKEDGVLDNVILISASSLRVLGIRVYTYFIDLLVPKSYYFKKADKIKFFPEYEIEPISLKLADFPVRLGTITNDLCSFRHLVKPYNVYVEVKFKVGEQVKLLKIRPHEYVRKDCNEAIERMIQRFEKKYWKELYSYYKQIEAIDLGMNVRKIRFGPQKFLSFEEL